jgi:hypothetical protein
MTIIDTLCLWVGYCVCVLALIRIAAESLLETCRAVRRTYRYLSVRWSLAMDSVTPPAPEIKNLKSKI